MLTYSFTLYGGWLVWASATGARPAPMLLLAGSGFWALRAVLQPVLFSMRNTPSIAITIVFVLGVALHGWAAWSLVNHFAG